MSTSEPRVPPAVCATGGGAAGATEAGPAFRVWPQVPQNLKLRLFEVLHFGHTTWSPTDGGGPDTTGPPPNAGTAGEEPCGRAATGATGIGGAAIGGI